MKGFHVDVRGLPSGHPMRQQISSPVTVAIERVRDAIENEGINPEYHREVMRTFQQEWPSLWRAIKHLLDVSR
jgi:hypothetical protein